MDAAAIRAAWLRQLFSTEPAGRPAAEDAAPALYAAVELPAPRRILWFDSPRDAAWAAALLLAPHCEPWGLIVRQARRVPAHAAIMERFRQHLRRADVLESAGPSLEERIAESLRPARLSLYPDLPALQRHSIFTDADDLYRAESSFRGPRQGVLGLEESARPGGILINHSELSLYTMAMMAADEAQAGGGPVPPLLAALWALARSSGPWWAFEHAILLTGRPSEIHRNRRLLLHRADGPAVVYRDGWCVYAWEGEAVDKPGPPEPFEFPVPPPAPRRTRQTPAPRRAPTPARQAQPGGGYLDRYLAGEYKPVWDELIALGPAVREAPHAEAARLVARETMRRVAANVRTVVQRLRSLGYRFKYRAHVPPDAQTAEHLKQLDELAGPAPLSLEAFYEVAGAVDFTGHHDLLAADSRGYFLPDPLVVFPLAAMQLEYDENSGSNYGAISLAPDAYHKADYSGGAPYEIKLPDARADGELRNERHNLFFVDYLRLAFRYGGFPGYDGIEHLPAALDVLSQGLLPF